MKFRYILSTAVWCLLLAGTSNSSWAFSTETPGGAVAVNNGGNQIAASNDPIRDIKIEGNQRIEASTITSYLGLKPGDSFSQTDIDSGLKNLFATGFFSDVKLTRSGNTLMVHVVENAVINKVAFEGNDRVDTKDLEKEVELKPRSVYSQEKVQSDVKRILDIYRRGGRYNATVTPKIIQQDQNRVDLVYEITEGPIARIEKISFIGNKHFPSEDLRKAIRTEETRWYKFLSDNDKFDPDRLQFDQELLRRFYINEGFADFQVKSAHAELSSNKDAFYVTFVIEEGPQYNFGNIRVVSELKNAEKIDFTDLIQTHAGESYNASLVESTVDAMTKELGNRGYAFVDIEPKVERDTPKLLANITYTIKPGPRVYVERINITGNVRTLDEVIRREFRLAEGDPYNSALLQRSEQRLNNLGFFEKVNVKNVPGSAPDKTVVNVDIKEKSTGEVNVGAGFSTTDGPLANFGIKESNLLGTGQELKTSVTYAEYRKDGEISYTNPYTFDRELSSGVDLYKTDVDLTRESSYISKTTGINLRMGYALSEHLDHGLYYTIHENDISSVPTTASIFIQEQAGSDVTSAVGQSLTYDMRDNKIDPTKGYSIRLSEELAGFGGDDRYVKHEAKAVYYIPVAPKWVMSFTGSGGDIFGFDDREVRINDRFFVGGDNLRGFRDSGIGPRDTSTRDALGGNKYTTGNAELRFPVGLPEEMGVSGALFTDAGSLWDTPDRGPTVFDNNSVRISSGFGMLWSSPFGPIRIDFAEPIMKQKEDITEVVRFSFGTHF